MIARPATRLPLFQIAVPARPDSPPQVAGAEVAAKNAGRQALRILRLLAFWLNLDPKQPHVMKTLIAGLREHHDRLIRRLSPGAMRRLHEHLFMAPKAPSKEQP